MSIAFVLGNGRSRLAVDPHRLKPLGAIYACNAIYRDFIPDYLIAVDYGMVTELVENNIQNITQVWTTFNEQSEKIKGINYIRPSRGSSGPSALWLASSHGHATIFMLGFDYAGLDHNTKFNNVYADTRNYSKSSAPPPFLGNWVLQTERTIKEFPQTQYYRIVEQGQYMPNWENFNNIEHMTYETFKSQINDDLRIP